MRIAALVICTLVAAGCGFRPANAPQPSGDGAGAPASVRVQPIPERVGQLLRAELVNRLHAGAEPRDPAFLLDVSVDERITQTGFRRDESETRRNIRLTASYVLRRADTRETVLKGDTEVTTSTNVLDQPYATRVMRRDARARGARGIAERIARDVTSKLGS
ncbi:LPS-assembly lipoprotein [Limimonas halophila]|uniref:LPS-assembly lipoprotein n=1 Tax=Limimonas halophila TaxID=1082479 RepID=A0A1G7SAK4_9PROT|nr:LPS assembly lipoprotein LptE [Limimonas halophila]SDG19489.1 LPS-assembly lipoprotein [Limimonas halophila]